MRGITPRVSSIAFGAYVGVSKTPVLNTLPTFLLLFQMLHLHYLHSFFFSK
jgi:hypothetical protein